MLLGVPVILWPVTPRGPVACLHAMPCVRSVAVASGLQRVVAVCSMYHTLVCSIVSLVHVALWLWVGFGMSVAMRT